MKNLCRLKAPAKGIAAIESVHILTAYKFRGTLFRGWPYRPRHADAGEGTPATTAGQQAVTAQRAGGSAGMSLASRVGGASSPVVLLLVGPPGSGKSTFSAALIAQAQALWTRVNQVRPCTVGHGGNYLYHWCCEIVHIVASMWLTMLCCVRNRHGHALAGLGARREAGQPEDVRGGRAARAGGGQQRHHRPHQL